jgi:putative hemolysin
MSLTLGLVLLVLALAGSSFFSGMETAIISANRLNFLVDAEKGDRRARRALKELRDPQLLITTILVGNNICNVGASTVATALLVQYLPDQLVNATTVIASLSLTPLLFVFSELLPKAVARTYANRLTRTIIPLLQLFKWLFIPISLIAGGLSRLLFRIKKLDPSSAWRISREELRVLLRQGERHSAIETPTARMAGAAFHFSEREVREVMTPLRELRAIPASAGVDQAYAEASAGETPFLIVYEERVDRIVGVLPVGELLRAPLGSRLGELARRPLFVPESKSLEGMLDELQHAGANLAVVVDEFGSTLGVVTLDHLLGAILDVIPSDDEDGGAPLEATQEIVLPAETTLVELTERYEVRLPSGDYATLAGLIIDRLERIPERGAELTVEGWRLRVVEADPRRILSVSLSRLEED